jgi:nucleoside-diphosphate-sugar epimerase
MLHVLFSKADGEAINVGNNAEEISMGTLAERMSEIAAPPRLPIEYRVNHDPQYLTDSPQRRSPDLTKMRSLAPWHPEVSLTEGLRRTLYSYRELMRREIADGTTSGSQYDLD